MKLLSAPQATHAATYQRIRAAAARAGREVAILQDLGGPKIRTGLLEGHRAIPLAAGDTLRIATGDFVGGPGRVATTFAGLAQGVAGTDRQYDVRHAVTHLHMDPPH